MPLGRVCGCHSGECVGTTRASVRVPPKRSEQLAPSGADRMNRFYRYNSVCCPLKVFLIGKLDEKLSALSLRAGRVTRSEQSERLASSEASNSLQVGRASRSEQGEHLASGGASISLRAGRVIRFGRGEHLASGGADRMNRFYRYNSVCCPLKVFLIGKLDEKASALSLRVGRESCSEQGE